jgi:hypothetical protein
MFLLCHTHIRFVFGFSKSDLNLDYMLRDFEVALQYLLKYKKYYIDFNVILLLLSFKGCMK